MELHPVIILLIAIAIVFLLIIRLKINAMIALITAATAVGLMSSQVELAEVMPTVASDFGRLCGSIGIVIALAALIGQCLMESGAADKITRDGSLFVINTNHAPATVELSGTLTDRISGREVEKETTLEAFGVLWLR